MRSCLLPGPEREDHHERECQAIPGDRVRQMIVRRARQMLCGDRPVSGRRLAHRHQHERRDMGQTKRRTDRRRIERVELPTCLVVCGTEQPWLVAGTYIALDGDL